VLSSKLSLHDVDDVERFAARVLDLQLGKWRAHLRADDRESAHAYLISECWLLSERYDPTRNTSFSKYAHNTLKLRLVDWYRAHYGDSRHGRSGEQPLSLNAPADAEHNDIGDILERFLENLGSAVLRHNPVTDSASARYERPRMKLLAHKDPVGLLQRAPKRPKSLERVPPVLRRDD
jgi:hypothetical protein